MFSLVQQPRMRRILPSWPVLLRSVLTSQLVDVVRCCEVFLRLFIILKPFVYDVLQQEAVTPHNSLSHMLTAQRLDAIKSKYWISKDETKLKYSDLLWVIFINFSDKRRSLSIEILNQALLLLRINFFD